MRLSRLPLYGAIGRYCLVLAVIGICTMFLTAGADTYGSVASSDVYPEIEVAEKSTRQKRIKRLKLADPESTEVMLA